MNESTYVQVWKQCTYYMVDVLWGQPIKLAQVACTSDLRENQQSDLFSFDIVPCHFCRASEAQTYNRS